MLQLQPITQKEANAFIKTHHRHHNPPQGYKFAIGLNDGKKVVGVVTVGRPVARMIAVNEPLTAEVTRCCTDGTPNACSKLYAAAWRACRAMGYNRLITYVLCSERGASLKASGWKELYSTKKEGWNRPSRKRFDTHPIEQKTLWAQT